MRDRHTQRERETDTHTHRDRERETDRHTEIERERQTDTHRERERERGYVMLCSWTLISLTFINVIKYINRTFKLKSSYL